MMRKNIIRTLTKATINGYTVDMVEGKPVVTALHPVTAWGKLTDKEAEKAFSAAYENAKVFVGGVDYTEETYCININTFVANATRVENKVAEAAEE